MSILGDFDPGKAFDLVKEALEAFKDDPVLGKSLLLTAVRMAKRSETPIDDTLLKIVGKYVFKVPDAFFEDGFDPFTSSASAASA